MPALATERLLIRPLTLDDLPAIHRILDVELAEADFGGDGAQTLADRRAWLEWTVLAYQQLASLYQPPYGERGIALKEGGVLIGAVGFAPLLMPFGLLPGFAAEAAEAAQEPYTAEVGLYWAVSPAHQRRGYATEAARAMIEYAFRELRLKRILATTTHDNLASQGVMRKLGMRLEKNPHLEPPWLQVAGMLDHAPPSS